MKIKKTIPTGETKIIDYFTDEISLRIIAFSPNPSLTTVDPDSMGTISRFPIILEPNSYYHSTTDDSSIYIPTTLGQILVMDKFSGETNNTINLGNVHIMSDIEQDFDKIYCICGIPVCSNNNINFSKYCVVICDKESGKKEIQTNYFEGHSNFLLIKDKIWVVSEKSLFQYSKEGILEKTLNLDYSSDYTPVIIDNYIICISSSGIIQIVNIHDLSLHASMEIKPPVSIPIKIKNTLAWMVHNGVCFINVKDKTFKVFESNKSISNPTSLVNLSDSIYSCTSDGSVIKFNGTSQTQSIKLTQNTLWKPVIVDNYIFIASENQLHQIEV